MCLEKRLAQGQMGQHFSLRCWRRHQVSGCTWALGTCPPDLITHTRQAAMTGSLSSRFKPAVAFSPQVRLEDVLELFPTARADDFFLSWCRPHRALQVKSLACSFVSLRISVESMSLIAHSHVIVTGRVDRVGLRQTRT